MNLAENIKKLRKQHNMEQKDLAQLLHISDKTVSSWERGRTEPKMGMIEKMCEIFHCEKSELIDGNVTTSDESIIELATRIVELTPDKRTHLIKYLEFIEKGKDE